MRRARRLGRLAVAVAVAAVATVPAALAALPAPAAAAAPFADVGTHWALQAVDRMALKGIVRGVTDVRFEPDRAVTRLEAVVFLVRLLGLEARAQATTALPASFRSQEVIPAWARGYVAVAVEEGVLAGSDLVYFRGAEPAKRYEVAVLAVRALGAEDEADRLSSEPVPFSDRLDIPVLWWGYVNAAVNRDLMGGRPDGTFGGAAAVTRAEMATLLARMDDQLDTAVDANEVRGTIKAVVTSAGGTPTVTLSRAGAPDVSVALPGSASLYRDGRPATVGSLRLGDAAVAWLTVPAASLAAGGQAAAAYLEATSPPILTSGVIEALGAGTLTLRLPSGSRPLFNIAGADVRLGANRTTAASLAAGMPATIEAREDGKVLRVWADPLAGEVTGKVAGVEFTTGGAYLKLTVATPRGDRERAYPVAATSTVSTVNGTVVSLTIAEQKTLVVSDASGNQTSFVLADDAVVVRATGAAGSLLELTPGQAVTLEVRTGRVAKVTIRGLERYHYLVGTVRYVQGATLVVDADAGTGAIGVPAGGVVSREVRLDGSSVVVRFDAIGYGAATALVKVGDRVLAAGTFSSGVLTARTLTVVEAARD